jgi:phosphoribosylanthranilate isomerase
MKQGEEKKKIKVCGVARAAQISQLGDLGVDYCGMIFYEKSPRFAGKTLEASQIKALHIPKKVGVFVNASIEEIRTRIKAYGLDMVQLHGDESPEFCAALAAETSVVKAFRIRQAEDIPQVDAYEEYCTYFLFDTAGPLYGGNGVPFDWKLLDSYTGSVPFFLSGGIGPADTARLAAFSHPAWQGIDINSRFEIRPGEKNLEDIKRFLWDLNIT